MAAWEMIVNDPQLLIQSIRRFQPSVEASYKIKGRLQVNNERPQDAGFMKLAIHAISFSSLGPQAATPMGGERTGQGLHGLLPVDARVYDQPDREGASDVCSVSREDENHSRRL